MSGKPDVANLAGFFRRKGRLRRAPFGKDAVGIVEPDNFVKLKQVDMVHLEAFQRLFKLLVELLRRAPHRSWSS